MAARWVAFGLFTWVVAVTASMTASSGITGLFPNSTHPPVKPGAAQLRAFGGRSAAQRAEPATQKFDGMLADGT